MLGSIKEKTFRGHFQVRVSVCGERVNVMTTKAIEFATSLPSHCQRVLYAGDCI